MFRQAGQWVRFTIDFTESADYNFVYRGNIKGFAIASHKFDLKIFQTSDISTPVYSKVIDLSSHFPAEGTVANNVLRIGGGNADTDWFKVLDEITLTTGTYVVELGTPYHTFTHAPWGCFTFNKAVKYEGKAFEGQAWRADKDIIPLWKFDKIGDGISVNAEKDITFGLYNTTTGGNGDNKRAYTDVNYDVLKWNSATQTMLANGAWFNYTVRFQGRAAHFLKFRALPLNGEAVWEGTIKILEPKTKLAIAAFSLDDDVDYISDDDAGGASRWMYIKKPMKIPEGTYLVQFDLPVSSPKGLLGAFGFVREHPVSLIPQVINYEWPKSIPRSDKYEVKITQNGQEHELFPHLTLPDTRPSLYPPDNGGFGIPRFMTDRTLTFTQFAFTDKILVEVSKRFGTPAKRIEIQPKAYGINPIYFDGKTVRFYLEHQKDRPSYISVNFISEDNLDAQDYNHVVPKHGLMLFGDRLEVHVPEKTAQGTVIYNENVSAADVQNADLIYFPPGDYDLKDKFTNGIIRLSKNGQKVYAEGGAYIRGTVWSEGYDDIWLYGRGIFTGADYIFHELLNEEGVKEAYMKFIGSDNIHVEGIAITDPCHHTIPSGSNSYFKNMKIMGWSHNADGTRVGGGAYITEVFMRTMDDRDYADRRHVFNNSVLWPMRNGAFAMLGWQSFDGGRAVYENLYFINSEWDRPEDKVGNQGVLGSKNKQGGNISNDTLRHLFLEDYTTILTVLRHTYDPERAFDPNDPGEFKDFLFENIKVEHPFIKSTGEQAWQRIEGYEHLGVRSSVHDITFRNLIVAGELVTNANKDQFFKINDKFAYNIFFEASGKIHTIRATAGAGGKVFPGGDVAVPQGTSQYISIQPEEGYRIKDIKIDSVSIGNYHLQNITIDSISSDHLIEVEFEMGDNYFDLSEIPDIKTFLRTDIDLGINYNTSIREIKAIEKPQLLVYPNPAKDYIYIKGVQDGAQMSVFSSMGQKVADGVDKMIDISHLQSGIYILKVDTRFCRFIVE